MKARKKNSRTARRPNISWRRTVKGIKKSRRKGGMKDWQFPSRMKQVWKDKRKRAKNPAPKVRPAKTGRWYKGPRGVRIRVTRRKGKTIVEAR